MDIALVIVLSVLPGLLWLCFFYRRDTLRAEPKRLIVKMFACGMLLLGPVLLLEYPCRGLGLWQLVLAAPLIEELLKFAAVRTFIYSNKEFNGPIDGIEYAAATALGFATAENVYYIIAGYLAPQIALGRSDPLFAAGFVWKLYLIRAFVTVPGHAIWSGMWGYALGHAKCSADTGRERLLIIQGILAAVALHSLFNFLMTNFQPGAVGMLILVPVMWKMIDNRIRKAIAEDCSNNDTEI